MSGDFAEGLAVENEISISFARKDGRKRTIPIWFTIEGGRLQLLPMYGSKTKWLADVEREGSVIVRSGELTKSFRPKVVRDQKSIDGIKRNFSGKYGESDVRKYYPAQDVALEIDL